MRRTVRQAEHHPSNHRLMDREGQIGERVTTRKKPLTRHLAGAESL
ncbi:hypothetical protein MCI89_06675 [Muricomes sp. OA1]|nr:MULTISPECIES: hypothetical protein [Clostridia]MCH1972026.1 hypothetical protein [Muricomes sp. OA1]